MQFFLGFVAGVSILSVFGAACCRRLVKVKVKPSR